MHARLAFAAFVAVIAACAPASPGTSPPGADATTAAATHSEASMDAAPPHASTASSTAQSTVIEAQCGMSLCGCWRPSHLSFASQIQDASARPVQGVEMVCHSENTPAAVSDAQGRLALEIDTQFSPGCHYARCTNFTLHDPNGHFADHASTYYAANGKTVTLEDAR